ncbi:PTS sugar transporter subunit IIA [Acidithiobacillus sp. IBUN Pt1247-S3]
MAALPLPAKAILLDSPATSAVATLEQLAEMLSVTTGVERKHIYQALAAREAQGSTALGSGVAVPHARLSELASTAVAALRSLQPIEFSAPDGVGVRIFVAVLVPASGTLEHLEILSRIAARLAQDDLRQQLLQVADVDSFRSLLLT